MSNGEFNVDVKIQQCQLDINKLKEELKRLEDEKLESEGTFKDGQWFLYDGNLVMLAQVLAGERCFISRQGNRYMDPVKTKGSICGTAWDDLSKMLYKKDARTCLVPVNVNIVEVK